MKRSVVKHCMNLKDLCSLENSTRPSRPTHTFNCTKLRKLKKDYIFKYQVIIYFHPVNWWSTLLVCSWRNLLLLFCMTMSIAQIILSLHFLFVSLFIPGLVARWSCMVFIVHKANYVHDCITAQQPFKLLYSLSLFGSVTVPPFITTYVPEVNRPSTCHFTATPLPMHWIHLFFQGFSGISQVTFLYMQLHF